MAKYVRVEDPDAEKFLVSETFPDDPAAPQGQHLHPETHEEMAVDAHMLEVLTDALDEDDRLKIGYYSLDQGKYLGLDRPDE